MMYPYGEILERLAAISNAGVAVDLLNVYKGIPISYEAYVDKVIQGSAIFKMNKYQATCLELDRITHAQSQHLGGVVRGNVLSVDFENNTAAVTGFLYVDSSIGNRILVRVYPEEPLPVEMIIKKQEVRGTIADISAGGIGIRTTNPYYDPSFLALDTELTVHVVLPSSDGAYKLRGLIKNVNKGQENYRLGIQTGPDPKTKAVLKQYVARRQADLMRELKTMNDAFYRLRTDRG